MPSHSPDPLPRPVPRLERQIEDMSLAEWPGRRGPLVCLADPLGSLPGLPEALATALSPDWRVLELSPSPDLMHQVQASQVLRLLDTFGFEHPVLLGGGLASVIALLVAAWYPTRVAGLILVNPGLTSARRLKIAALSAEQPAWRAWLDAPPAWVRLERQVTCPILRVRARGVRRIVDEARGFLESRVQSAPCC